MWFAVVLHNWFDVVFLFQSENCAILGSKTIQQFDAKSMFLQLARAGLDNGVLKHLGYQTSQLSFRLFLFGALGFTFAHPGGPFWRRCNWKLLTLN